MAATASIVSSQTISIHVSPLVLIQLGARLVFHENTYLELRKDVDWQVAGDG